MSDVMPSLPSPHVHGGMPASRPLRLRPSRHNSICSNGSCGRSAAPSHTPSNPSPSAAAAKAAAHLAKPSKSNGNGSSGEAPPRVAAAPTATLSTAAPSAAAKPGTMAAPHALSRAAQQSPRSHPAQDSAAAEKVAAERELQLELKPRSDPQLQKLLRMQYTLGAS